MMVRRAGQLDYGVVDTGWATESHRIKGANRRISERRCRWHRLFFVYRFRKAEKSAPRKRKAFATVLRRGSWVTGRLVVTQHGQFKYIRKGGHGGSRRNACRPQAAALGKPQGGRAAAAVAKVKRVAEAAAAAAKASELSSLLRFFKLQPPSSEQPPISK